MIDTIVIIVNYLKSITKNKIWYFETLDKLHQYLNFQIRKLTRLKLVEFDSFCGIERV